MLSSEKLREICRERKIGGKELAEHLVRGGFSSKEAQSALKNWQKGLYKPIPGEEDIKRLATALSVEENNLKEWRGSYRYAPMSARKSRLVTQLVAGRRVQDALDTLKYTSKRAASMIEKVLKAVIADADEQNASVEDLYVKEARVDDAGIRIGTKRWHPKDRGRAHAIHKKACHIRITVTEVK